MHVLCVYVCVCTDPEYKHVRVCEYNTCIMIISAYTCVYVCLLAVTKKIYLTRLSLKNYKCTCYRMDHMTSS